MQACACTALLCRAPPTDAPAHPPTHPSPPAPQPRCTSTSPAPASSARTRPATPTPPGVRAAAARDAGPGCPCPLLRLLWCAALAAEARSPRSAHAPPALPPPAHAVTAAYGTCKTPPNTAPWPGSLRIQTYSGYSSAAASAAGIMQVVSSTSPVITYVSEGPLRGCLCWCAPRPTPTDHCSPLPRSTAPAHLAGTRPPPRLPALPPPTPAPQFSVQSPFYAYDGGVLNVTACPDPAAAVNHGMVGGRAGGWAGGYRTVCREWSARGEREGAWCEGMRGHLASPPRRPLLCQVIVGYDATAGMGSPNSYWIIRNSWG